MRTNYFLMALAAMTVFALSLSPAVAAPVSERTKRDCRADYERYCKAYEVGTEALRACMSRSVKKLSNRCVEALVDAGEMSRGQADRLKASKTASKKATTKKTSSSKKATTRKSTSKTSARRPVYKRTTPQRRTTTQRRSLWGIFKR